MIKLKTPIEIFNGQKKRKLISWIRKEIASEYSTDINDGIKEIVIIILSVQQNEVSKLESEYADQHYNPIYNPKMYLSIKRIGRFVIPMYMKYNKNNSHLKQPHRESLSSTSYYNPQPLSLLCY